MFACKLVNSHQLISSSDVMHYTLRIKASHILLRVLEMHYQKVCTDGWTDTDLQADTP